ncbi:MAG: prkC 10 [Gemmataceae bacterium]|nr:prkC 10 [Gemmataceae bacterium]
MPDTPPLTELLTGVGVLPADRAAEAARVEQLIPDCRTFVTELLRLGMLTRLQAKQVGRGRAHHLAVGRYVLLDRLGAGGMGRVFLARHRDSNQLVAIKLARLDRRHCPKTRARFLREVRLVGRLNHLHVVHALDAGFAHGMFYLALEYVHGPDLGRVVGTEGPLVPGRACEYVRQAALGLGHIHRQGIIHRDVKPSNLGLAAGGRVVKVLDVGLARSDEDGGLSVAGRLLGSADYTAPEQVADPRRVDPRADIYALGCSLYNLLAGEVPFPGGSVVQKALRHRSDTPRPVEDLREDLPAGLGEVVRRMMARRRRDRVQTADEVADILARFATPVGLPAPPADTIPGPPTTADLPTLTELG